MPAAQSAVLGEPQALHHVWVDAAPEASGRLVDDPTHQLTILSSLVPELVTFIENIRNQKPQNVLESSFKPSLYQLTQSQVMAEATLPKLPKPAKNHSVKKPTNERKSAFRRNPLLPNSTLFTSQPLEPSLDTSAASGISYLTTQSAQEGNLTLTLYEAANGVLMVCWSLPVQSKVGWVSARSTRFQKAPNYPLRP